MNKAIIRNYARYADRTVFFDSIDHFLNSEVHTGINVIRYGSEFLEIRLVDNQVANTIVMFHAAVDPNQTSLPVFVGNQLASHLDTNVIYVSDPALDKRIAIGWFSGDRGRPLQSDLTRVIDHAHKGLTTSQNLIFFGASAGGFAALHYSHKFEGSLAVVSNPQTNIELYFPTAVQLYKDVCWGGVNLSQTGITYDLVPLYGGGFENSVAYLQNSRDDLHVEKHFLPWARSVSGTGGKWKCLVDDWGEGHAPAPFFLLVGILGWAIECNGDWDKFLSDPDFSNEYSQLL